MIATLIIKDFTFIKPLVIIFITIERYLSNVWPIWYILSISIWRHSFFEYCINPPIIIPPLLQRGSSSVITSSRFCKRKLIELCFLLDNLLVEPLVRIQDIYVMPFEKLKLRGHPRFSNNNFRNLRSGLLSHLRWQQISPQAKHKLAVTKPQYGRFKSSSAKMNSSKSEMQTISDFVSDCWK